MLREIGEEEEAQEHEAFAANAKKAYHYYFIKDGHVTAPRQAPMVRSLALGLPDGTTRLLTPFAHTLECYNKH